MHAKLTVEAFSEKFLSRTKAAEARGVKKRDVPSAESSRSVQRLGKGVTGKPYPRLCNARRPRLEPGTFRSQAVKPEGLIL